MITQPTVFILGAGASRPYGYPTGQELREQICNQFDSAVRSYFGARERNRALPEDGLRRVKEFQKIFRKSTTKSIDLFLGRNPEFMELGKIAITLTILSAETNSKFRERTDYPDQDWYSLLFERLTDALVKKDDYKRLSENKVGFITFNYDRSLEHFLYESLVNSFNNIEPKEIIPQLNAIKIIHMFGQVAGLEWQNVESKISYKPDLAYVDVPALAKKLMVVYEEAKNPAIEEARGLIEKAQRLYFLGFGYAKENLEILGIPEIIQDYHRIYGTAWKWTGREIEGLAAMFGAGSRVPAQRTIRSFDCVMLLRECL